MFSAKVRFSCLKLTFSAFFFALRSPCTNFGEIRLLLGKANLQKKSFCALLFARLALILQAET